uniref:Putative secreted protein n=1 Tax=Ixodes ricinus TaxID=34613 RepID=A0A6B0U0J6_IXORI
MARGKGFGLFSSGMWLQPLALCGHVQEWHGHPRHSTSRTVNTKTMVPLGRREILRKPTFPMPRNDKSTMLKADLQKN